MISEQNLKCIRDCCEAHAIAGWHDSVVPFDPASKRCIAHIGTSDEGDAITMWKVDDVGLGMKCRLTTLEYPKLGRARSAYSLYLEIEQPRKSVRFGYVPVVAGKKAESTSSQDEVLHMLFKSCQSTAQDESNSDIETDGSAEMCGKMRKKRIVAPGDQRALVRRLR